MSELQQWRFWCDGCSVLELHQFNDRDRERLASVAWLKEHHGHDKGGFVTPEPWRWPCDRCGVGISKYHLCPRCKREDDQ